MAVEYFNFQTEHAASRSQRRAFLNRWWSLGCDDSGWTPPDYSLLHRHLVSAGHPHLKRLEGLFLSQEAVRRQRGSNSLDLHAWVDSGGMGGASLGITTAAAGILLDERLAPGTAYLFSPHVINDPACAESLLDALATACAELGIGQLIGPCSFSPYLQSAVQSDYWHLPTPNLVASNPPYIPELLAQYMQPVEPISHLWQLPLPKQDSPPTETSSLKFETLEPARLAGDLLPLMVAGCENSPGFPPPDALEASFLLAHLPQGSHGWLASLAGEPVGFVELGPEISPAVRRWRGGRNPAARLLLDLALRQPFQHGRIYLAGVLPRFRRQGIGNQILRQAIRFAQAQGWRSLVTGLLADGSPGAALLASAGAHMSTAYQFYKLEW